MQFDDILKSELSNLLENLQKSRNMNSDVLRIFDILETLGVLKRPNGLQNWPKCLTLEEIKAKIGKKLYFVNLSKPTYDSCDYIISIKESPTRLYLQFNKPIDNYGIDWLAFDRDGYSKLCEVDPKRFNKYLFSQE